MVTAIELEEEHGGKIYSFYLLNRKQITKAGLDPDLPVYLAMPENPKNKALLFLNQTSKQSAQTLKEITIAEAFKL